MKSPSGIVIISALMLILITNKISETDAVIEDVLDIIHIVKEISSGILKTWDIVQQTSFGQSIEFPLMREKQRKVLQRLKEVSRHISATEEKYEHAIMMAIQSVNSFMSIDNQLNGQIREITDIINRISSRFYKMQQYNTTELNLETMTLINFAEWTVGPNSNSVDQLLEQLHFKFLGPEKEFNANTNLLSVLRKHYETSDEICRTQQSAQLFLYSLYSDIAITELKAYAMITYSWMILRTYQKGNYTAEAQLMRDNFESRNQRTLKVLREVMRRADRTVWRCDPDKHVKNETYDEVTRLLQGHIENEIDMNTEETCRENCGFYEATRSHGCYKDMQCSRQPRCSGKLYDCTYVDSDMWICPSLWNSTRRYEYIEYENGRVLGRKTECNRGTTKVDSWWRYLFWHCSYCFCLCDEQGAKSDRYFSLLESVSDVNKNKIVTGLKIVKVNRVFHIQIQEGELLPRGKVNASTLEWKPLNTFNIYSREVLSGRDYHTMGWEKRAIDLDDIHGDGQWVVIGVRFRVVGAHLNLEAKLAEMNFETGKLLSPMATSYWQSNDNTDNSEERRHQIKLNDPDVSTETLAKSIPISKHNQYVEFVNTGMDKDASQTTVPFIDIQEVVSDPPVPLSGIGIYLKGQNGFGGFIAPKIITFDYSQYVRVQKPST